MAGSAAASAVVVFLIAGAAFAGNAIRTPSGADSSRDQVEATSTDEPTEATETAETTETAEPTETAEATETGEPAETAEPADKAEPTETANDHSGATNGNDN